MAHPAVVSDCKMAIEWVKDSKGIDQIVLRNPRGASAKVSLQGGQVISWRNARGDEYLFNSSKVVKAPKVNRGGIAICFPQFSDCGSLEQQGFARNKLWIVDEAPPPLPAKSSNGSSFIDLLLKPSKEDLKIWPHSFELRLRVCLGLNGNLTLTSRVRNITGKPFRFSFAYHSYLSVSDISEVRIEGLETMDYLDNLCKKERFTDQGDAITFEAEFDRLYLLPLGPPNIVAVLDHQRRRTYVIRREGLSDVVVWNPWAKKAKAMADMGVDEYRRMVCVDGAKVANPITLKPGEEWTGRLEITVAPSSFNSEGLCF
ncbi:Aldose 1-/Glucose-6-phosphate 1-epimerase [Artemisia annua]|uniref:glucose-6-phosphate 1-epimerase n=1 Tax=Artemisia annua TaxID=35608 RepID=A0A2U1LIV4_ARTAN|nr:Aldose 1-/Glucose-6-phosphate 1-epimerase [Artemisia annua]